MLLYSFTISHEEKVFNPKPGKKKFLRWKPEWGELTSDSAPASSCCCSGLVVFGSKAVFDVRAASSSEPLLLYSFGSGFSSSLP